MVTYEMIHEIDETTRLAASYDDTRYALADIAGDGLNVFVVSQPSRMMDFSSGNLTGILETIRDTYTGDTLDHALGLFFAGAGIAFKRVSLRGYSQGEWAEVIVYNSAPEDPAEWLEDPAAFDDLRRWFAGDIYRVDLQKLVIYTAPNGNTLEVWETQDDKSAFGVPLSWDSNLAQIAAELDLTELAGF